MWGEDSEEKMDSAAVVGFSCGGGISETHGALASVPTSVVECSGQEVDRGALRPRAVR